MYSVEKTKGPNVIKNFDLILFLSVLMLSGIGLVILNSATRLGGGGPGTFKKQVICFVIGLIFFFIISFFDYKDFKSLGIFVYLFGIILLVLVLFVGIGGSTVGSKSWIKLPGIGTFQPSEFVKIAFVVFLSIFFERIKEGTEVRKNILKLAIYAVIPILLVVKQHDDGTAMVFMFIFCVMVFISGIPYRYILGGFVLFAASLPVLWFKVLEEYQKNRILSFLNPDADPLNTGYNVIRSRTAIGSGRIFGQGLFNGLQSQTENGIPVKESDFIFSVVGEELGFVGAIVVLSLVFFILLRCIYIARNSRDTYGSFLVIGITAMFGFHSIENIGMSIGLLPVTGIPLPFVSGGGTAMIAYYMALGVIMSVSMRRKKAIFNSD